VTIFKKYVYISYDYLYFYKFNYFILQYVVIPTRRSTAEAFQILIAHALGDAGSPYLIGLVCRNKLTTNITSN